MPLVGVKRTSIIVAHIAAFDPKRTLDMLLSSISPTWMFLLRRFRRVSDLRKAGIDAHKSLLFPFFANFEITTRVSDAV